MKNTKRSPKFIELMHKIIGAKTEKEMAKAEEEVYKSRSDIPAEEIGVLYEYILDYKDIMEEKDILLSHGLIRSVLGNKALENKKENDKLFKYRLN